VKITRMAPPFRMHTNAGVNLAIRHHGLVFQPTRSQVLIAGLEGMWMHVVEY
jgi:hypothetical protein